MNFPSPPLSLSIISLSHLVSVLDVHVPAERVLHGLGAGAVGLLAHDLLAAHDGEFACLCLW